MEQAKGRTCYSCDHRQEFHCYRPDIVWDDENVITNVHAPACPEWIKGEVADMGGLPEISGMAPNPKQGATGAPTLPTCAVRRSCLDQAAKSWEALDCSECPLFKRSEARNRIDREASDMKRQSKFDQLPETATAIVNEAIEGRSPREVFRELVEMLPDMDLGNVHTFEGFVIRRRKSKRPVGPSTSAKTTPATKKATKKVKRLKATKKKAKRLKAKAVYGPGMSPFEPGQVAMSRAVSVNSGPQPVSTTLLRRTVEEEISTGYRVFRDGSIVVQSLDEAISLADRWASQ